MSYRPPPDGWQPPADASSNGDITWLSEYEPEEVTYVEYPLLQSATFHLLTGRPDIGKGVLCAYWVARCTNGDMYGKPRRALWLSSEDSTKRTLRPRLDVAGGDPSLVALMPLSFQLPRDIDWLHDKLTSVVADAGLIIIDPIANHLASVDSNTEEPIRTALMPLNDLADALDTPIIGIRHVSTKDAKGSFLSRILGSTAWIAIPRVVIGVGTDDEERLHVRTIKGNAAPRTESGKRFRLVGVEYRGFERGMVRAVADGESDIDIDDLLGSKAKGSLGRKAKAEIVRALREQGGVMQSDPLDSLVAVKLGMSVHTVRDQRKTLREWGWVSAHPTRDGEKILYWNASLTNLAPSNGDLDLAIADPLAYTSGLEGVARGEAQNTLLAKNSENLPGMGVISVPPTQLGLEDPPEDDPSSNPPTLEGSATPTDSPSSVIDSSSCPVCGSAKVGTNSGRCMDCGSKVHPGTDWSTVHVPGLEENDVKP